MEKELLNIIENSVWFYLYDRNSKSYLHKYVLIITNQNIELNQNEGNKIYKKIYTIKTNIEILIKIKTILQKNEKHGMFEYFNRILNQKILQEYF